MIDFRRYLTTAEKRIIVMENAPTETLLNYIVLLKSSTQIYRGHLRHF